MPTRRPWPDLSTTSTLLQQPGSLIAVSQLRPLQNWHTHLNKQHSQYLSETARHQHHNKHLTHLCFVLVSSLSLVQHSWPTKLKGGKIDFGSRFQSAVRWLHCLQDYGVAGISWWKLLISWQSGNRTSKERAREREREVDGDSSPFHIMPQWPIPPTILHVLQRGQVQIHQWR